MLQVYIAKMTVQPRPFIALEFDHFGRDRWAGDDPGGITPGSARQLRCDSMGQARRECVIRWGQARRNCVIRWGQPWRDCVATLLVPQ